MPLVSNEGGRDGWYVKVDTLFYVIFCDRFPGIERWLYIDKHFISGHKDIYIWSVYVSWSKTIKKELFYVLILYILTKTEETSL